MQKNDGPMKIGVIGAGTMGSGIAHVFARSGFDVVLCDSAAGAVDQAIVSITRNLGREVNRGTITAEEQHAALSRIQVTSSLESVFDPSIVIEAISEQFEAKRSLLKKLDTLQNDLNFEERPALDKAKARTEKVHDDLLSGLMEGKK